MRGTDPHKLAFAHQEGRCVFKTVHGTIGLGIQSLIPGCQQLTNETGKVRNGRKFFFYFVQAMYLNIVPLKALLLCCVCFSVRLSLESCGIII